MARGYDELIQCDNLAIVDAAMKCEQVFNSHSRALVSISGGSDSDVMLDICQRVGEIHPIELNYVWFNTGIEYDATKRHLAYLEDRYGISIRRERAEKSIPTSCKEFGQPFLSKHVSTMCERLQRVGFQWEDEPFEVLTERYSEQVGAIKWWCNRWTRVEGQAGWFDIGRNKWLKEFMVENPPQFRISAKCCSYAKKRVSQRVEKELGIDVSLIGVRKAEGGVRASHNKCFDKGGHGMDTYRPLFWFSNDDKRYYENRFGVRHSDCYEVWGYKRTGCAGCPFGRQRVQELETLDMFEPMISRACRKVFADSYAYTAMFNDFKRLKSSSEHGQLLLDLGRCE